MKVGAHVSTAGGLSKAIDRAVALGAETIQLFGSSPRSWRATAQPQAEVDAFVQKAQTAGIGPAFLHGIYMINLGTEDPDNLEKGVLSLSEAMRLCGEIGALGVIFHPGSHKGRGYEGIFTQTVSSCQRVLEQTPEQVWLILENSAGMGNHIGSTFEELGRIVKAVGSSRVKVCLDTQHCYAAGYDITREETLDAAMQEFDRDIGLASLVAVHANDSKTPLASGVDRHENIGLGLMGEEAFATVMAHPAFREVPFLLEVPGMDGSGPDRENLERLKAIRQRVGLSA